MAKLAAGKTIPEFEPGDTVIVNVKVIEGERTRVQAYEGVCIARSGGGLNENFTVRKISYGEGVERVFPLYSPMIDSIKVVRRGKVRRAKLYYLRGLRGKSARIAEKQDHRRRGCRRCIARSNTRRQPQSSKVFEKAGCPAFFFGSRRCRGDGVARAMRKNAKRAHRDLGIMMRPNAQAFRNLR